MTTIVTRSGKGAPLSTAEVDANFTNLNGNKAELNSPVFVGVPQAPSAAADTNTVQLATTAYVVGQASSTNPTMNGTVTIGTSLRYARADHVHPTDTSRAPIASPTFTGTVSGITPSMIGLGNVNNTSDSAKPISTAQATVNASKAANGANSDITSITGLTTALAVNQGGSGSATVSGAQDNFGIRSGRTNRLHNSDLIVNQRGAGGVTTTSAYYSDRWQLQYSGTSMPTVTATSTYATNSTPSGARNACSIVITGSNKSSLAATDYFAISQAVEGIEISDFGWGSSYACPITVSFDIVSTTACTAFLAIRNGASNLSYVTPITVTTTWGRQSVTIPGPTTGTWDTGINAGLTIWFTFACGSTYTASSNNTWLSSNYIFGTGGSNMANAVGTTMYVAGVQLERGSFASPYMRTAYTSELLVCQRYYWQIGSVVLAGDTYKRVLFPTIMRTTPTLTLIGGSFGGGNTLTDNSGAYVPYSSAATSTTGWAGAFSADL